MKIKAKIPNKINGIIALGIVEYEAGGASKLENATFEQWETPHVLGQCSNTQIWYSVPSQYPSDFQYWQELEGSKSLHSNSVVPPPLKSINKMI